MNKKEKLLINILEEITRRYDKLFEENKKLLEEVSFKANHDVLTKLYNREFFEKQLQVFIDKKIPFCLAFMDLDNFKNANDTFGHKVGDSIIINVANILKENIKGKDLIARFGGDEFIIALIECNKENAIKILEKISNKIKKELNEFKITTSIGISCFPHEGEDFETLLKISDIKMYKAKEKRDFIIFWVF